MDILPFESKVKKAKPLMCNDNMQKQAPIRLLNMK